MTESLLSITELIHLLACITEEGIFKDMTGHLYLSSCDLKLWNTLKLFLTINVSNSALHMSREIEFGG